MGTFCPIATYKLFSVSLMKEGYMGSRSRLFLNCHISGFSYWDGIEAVNDLSVGSKLDLRCEHNNPYDPNAVSIYHMNKKLGYIPQGNNQEISQLLYFGHDVFEVYVSQINLEVHPEKQVSVAVRVVDARG